LGVAACSDDDDPQGPAPEVFVATLTGAQEVPAVNTPATGTARVEFTSTGLMWTVDVTNLQGTVTAGGTHIHGPALPGANAGVVLGLSPNVAIQTGRLAAGSATGTNTGAPSMDSLKAFIRTGRAYVNVHTTLNTGGHIRGQLVPGN
jgi:hypothetical protein